MTKILIESKYKIIEINNKKKQLKLEIKKFLILL